MISVYEARKIMIENVLNQKDMEALNGIMTRISIAASYGKYGVNWEECHSYSDTIEWALRHLGYRFNCKDCKSHYSYEVMW